MRSGIPFTGPPALGPQYKKFADWLHSPPNFSAISLNGERQRSTGPISSALGARIVLSDAQEVNASRDMRLYIDDCDPTNAVLKISPHVNYPHLPFPTLLPHTTHAFKPSPFPDLFRNLFKRFTQSSMWPPQDALRFYRQAFGLHGSHLSLAISSRLSDSRASRSYAHTAC